MFEISYTFTINECGGSGESVNVTLSDSSLRNYTISNSSSTPVEEDSSYTVSITAVGNGTRSEPSSLVSTSTSEAGIL